MTQFIFQSPWKHITSAARKAKRPAKVAVAYFGSSGDTLLPLPSGSLLVVDASLAAVQGGITHPGALRRLHGQGVKIFTLPMLHAKVFAFDGTAFVGSTNASTNSQKHLIEAVAKVTDATTVNSICDFVDGLCTDELADADLGWLETQYKPAQIKLPSISDRPYARLLMQVMPSDRQGYSGHQVQPTSGAWNAFFDVDIEDDDLPTLRLRNTDTGVVIDRRVVRHALVMTVDIPEANGGDIFEAWRVGHDRYDYRVVPPTSSEFKKLDRELKDTPNPHWRRGRLWIVT